MNNARFSEYATSGAFSLSLTRNQVSSLAMFDAGGVPDWSGTYMAALERKGLVERFPAPSDHDADKHEFRATHAGLLTAALCREAGLTNGAADPVAAELDRLRQEVIDRRQEAREARLTARSTLARLDEVEHALAIERAKAARERLPLYVTRRDPMPDLTREELARRAEEPAP